MSLDRTLIPGVLEALDTDQTLSGKSRLYVDLPNELFVMIHRKSSTEEFFGPFSNVVDVLIFSIPPEPSFSLCLFDLE